MTPGQAHEVAELLRERFRPASPLTDSADVAITHIAMRAVADAFDRLGGEVALPEEKTDGPGLPDVDEGFLRQAALDHAVRTAQPSETGPQIVKRAEQYLAFLRGQEQAAPGNEAASA